MEKNGGVHTRNHRRPARDSLVIDCITEESSDSPDNHLMGAREGGVSVVNRSVQGSIGAYHWIKIDQLGPGDANKQRLTMSCPRTHDLRESDVQILVAAIKTRSSPPKAGCIVAR